MAWEVRAYSGGAYACVTPRTGFVTRQADPNPPPPQQQQQTSTSTAATFTATSLCGENGTGLFADITWTGAAADSTISATGTDSQGPIYASGSGASGTLTLQGSDYNGISNISVTASTGGSVGLGNC